MIKVAILGATGYTGAELIRILSSHNEVKIETLISHSTVGTPISKIYPSLKGVCELVCEELDIEKTAKTCDVAFTALPHGASKEVIPKLYEKKVKVIDLSGDFRYNDVSVYEEWYGEKHQCPKLLEKSVYGLPELHRQEIKKAKIIGNPGCYTTCSILGLAPLLKNKMVETENIIIDAKSGVSGAGRGISQDYHFCECTETMKAYKIATHRHTSEIEQEYSLLGKEDIMVSFTPHLVPMKRGIFATIYANLKEEKSEEDLIALYNEFYKGEYFVRVCEKGQLPQIKFVVGSNFVDIGLAVDKRLNRVVVVSTIDNLVKGASGQAVQNMNLMFGFDEKEGLSSSGMYI